MNHLEEAKKFTDAMAEVINEFGTLNDPKKLGMMSLPPLALALISIAEILNEGLPAIFEYIDEVYSNDRRYIREIAESLEKLNDNIADAGVSSGWWELSVEEDK